MYYSMLLIILVFQSPLFFKYSIMYVCMSVFFLSVSLSVLYLYILLLRNQATSFDGVIPSGSLPLYF